MGSPAALYEIPLDAPLTEDQFRSLVEFAGTVDKGVQETSPGSAMFLMMIPGVLMGWNGKYPNPCSRGCQLKVSFNPKRTSPNDMTVSVQALLDHLATAFDQALVIAYRNGGVHATSQSKE